MLNWIKKVLLPSKDDLQAPRPANASPDPASLSGDGERYRQLGNQFFDQGKFSEAEQAYKNAIYADPNDARAHCNLGMLLRQQTREDAAMHLQRAIELDTTLSLPYYLLGQIALERSDLAEAERQFSWALERKTDLPEVFRDLGYVLLHAGKIHEAKKTIEQGIANFPEFTEFYSHLGFLCAQLSQYDEAIECFQKVLSENPDSADAHFSLGSIYHKIRDLDAAAECFIQACRLNPQSAEAQNSFGVVRHEQGNLADAQVCFRQAIRLNGSYAEAHNNMGIVCHEKMELDLAGSHLRQAILLNPSYVEAYRELGVVLHDQHNLPEAIAALEYALSLQPGNADVRWTIAIIRMQTVASQALDSDAFDQKCLSELSGLESWCEQHEVDGASIARLDPLFYLTAQESNCRPVLTRYGTLCARLMTIWFGKQNFTIPAQSVGGKIKIAIVSADLRDHPVWHAIVKGWYQHFDFDPNLYELHTFYLGTRHDAHTEYARSKSTAFVDMEGKDLRQFVQSVIDSKADLLLYPAVGSSLTVKLASMRLAPLQVATWGHPEASGLPEIDYFVSAQEFEPEDAQSHYSEKLICLPHLACTYPPLPAEKVDEDFSKYGINFEVPVLVCPGMPVKYPSTHDHVFVDIARKLGQCQFVFFLSHPPEYSTELKHRLEQVFAGSNLKFSDYCAFIPWQRRDAFFSLMRRAHVFLDTIGYSGFNTAMQAVQCHLPIVTREGKFMRGRFASGILKRIGLPELVVNTKEEYVDLAVRLVTDDQYRSAIRQCLQSDGASLFNDPVATRALQEFLMKITHRT